MGQKITLQNTGTNVGSVSYQNLSDLSLVTSMIILPNQIKTIWCVKNSLNIARIPNSNVVILSSEDFPPTETQTVTPQKRTTFLLGSIDESPNWQSFTFDYSTTSMVKTDTGFNYNDYEVWCCPSIGGLSKSGYMLFLNDNNNVGVTFFDYDGNQLETYTSYTENWDYYFLDNRFLIFMDYYNGVMKYSDGVTVKTITWDNGTSYFDIQTDYDGSINNKFFVVSGTNNYSTIQMVDMDGVTPLMNYDNRFYDVSIPMYSTSNFIPTIVYTDANVYSFFNIYDTNGIIVQEIDLTNFGYDYYNYDINYYGVNKMNIIFYDDEGSPYQIFNYNGDTNTLVHTSHQRGVNYGYWDTYYDYSYCSVNTSYSDDFHMVVYDTSGSWNGDFWSAGYADFISLFNDSNSFVTTTFNNSGSYDYKIALYETNVNQTLQMLVTDNNYYLSVFTISEECSDISNVCLLSSLNNYSFNTLTYNTDTFIFSTEVSGGYMAYAYDMDGVQLDARPLVGGYDYYDYFNTFYITDNVSGWYFNNETGNFLNIGYYDVYESWYNTELFNKPTKNNQPLLLVNWDSNETRILYNNSVSSPFILPTSNSGYDIRMGNDRFMYTYFNGSNKVVSNIYDLSFNLLVNYTTSEEYITNTILYNDRALLITYDNNSHYKVYALSENGNMTTTIRSNDYYYMANDILWWCGF